MVSQSTTLVVLILCALPLFGTCWKGFGNADIETNYERAPARIIHSPADSSKPIVSVIVTISSGSSYDSLFRSVPQVAPEGRVSVWHVHPNSISALEARLQSKRQASDRKTTVDELAEEIEALRNPESVVFNWECCSAWSEAGFGHYKAVTLRMVSHALNNKHMVIFSDYSLKALIKDWDTEVLGPNPFVNLGTFGGTFVLNFEPETLKKSPMAQLRTVGELGIKGSATIDAMGGTIIYSVNQGAPQTALYTLEALTVATKLPSYAVDGLDKIHTTYLKNYKGVAGHVVLHYASGGKLLTSAGHWSALSHMDVSPESVLRVAEQKYGAAYSQNVQKELDSARGGQEKESILQKYAAQFVSETIPCAYSGEEEDIAKLKQYSEKDL